MMIPKASPNPLVRTMVALATLPLLSCPGDWFIARIFTPERDSKPRQQVRPYYNLQR